MTQNLILFDKQKSLYGTIKIEEEEKKPAVDLLHATIGDYGFWQYKIAILMAFLRLPVNWFELGIVFLAPPTQFWCNFPIREGNSSNDEIFNNVLNFDFTIPKETLKPVCQLNTYNYLRKRIIHPYTYYLTIFQLTVEQNTCGILVENTTSIDCLWGYSYNRSVFASSIITEWDLVCERSGLVDLVQILIMIGVLFGSVGFGIAADKYGRKSVLVFTITLQFLASLIATYTPWFPVFLVIKFLSGLADGGITVTSFVMCMEVLGGAKRTVISILFHIPLGLGNIFMAGIAYYYRDWRQLSFAFSVISAIFMIYICLIPESPRWLTSVGKRNEAIKILEKAARANGRNSNEFLKTVEEFILTHEVSTKVEKTKLTSLFQTRELRKRSILLWINWFIMGIIFYGFNEYMGVISENIYIAEVIIGIASIPGYILSAYVALYFKRRTVIALFSFFTAACYVLVLLIEHEIIKNILIGLIFLGISVTTAMLPLFTGELYPTILRNAGIGSAAMCKKFGAVLAPLIIQFNKVALFLPMLSFAVLSISLGLLIIPLSETANKNLPDTVADIEED